MNARLSTLSALLTLAVLTIQVHASVLTFDNAGTNYWSPNGSVTLPKINDSTLPLYGDHISSATQGSATSPNAYSYGTTYGLTPDIGIAYGPGDPTHDRSTSNPIPVWYPINFGNLTNVMYQLDLVDTIGSTTSDLTMSITLTADPGFSVKLESFDLAGYAGSPSQLDSLEVVVDGTPNVIGTNLAISNTTHTSFNFTAAPYVGNTVEIFMDGRDAAPFGGNKALAYENFTDIGIDNIAFGELAPEPASLGLLACGSLLLLRRRAIAPRKSTSIMNAPKTP